MSQARTRMRVLMLLVLGATHDPRPLPEAVTVDAHVTFFFGGGNDL